MMSIDDHTLSKMRNFDEDIHDIALFEAIKDKDLLMQILMFTYVESQKCYWMAYMKVKKMIGTNSLRKIEERKKRSKGHIGCS